MRRVYKGTLIFLPLSVLLFLGMFLAITSTSLLGDLGGLSHSAAYIGVLNATALPLAMFIAGKTAQAKLAVLPVAGIVLLANVVLIIGVPEVLGRTILAAAAVSLILVGALLMTVSVRSNAILAKVDNSDDH
ncbi:MAG: hypothetical protein AAGI72_16745 [Pseudomonadota bacterium]